MHARYRRPIQGAYALSYLKNYESYVDDTIEMLAGVLNRYSQKREVVNLSLLVYYCKSLMPTFPHVANFVGSYDTIGKLTFGSTYGYLQNESDFNGLIGRQQQFIRYINLVSNALQSYNIDFELGLGHASSFAAQLPSWESHLQDTTTREK